MKVKFSWDTIISKKSIEYEIEEMSKDCIVNIVKFLLMRIPDYNPISGNLCFNLQDYFVYRLNMGKIDTAENISKEMLEEVIGELVGSKANLVEVRIAMTD